MTKTINKIPRREIQKLATWWQLEQLKPLILRGARQVGKSTLVREFSKSVGAELIEVNLEDSGLQLQKDFQSLNPESIVAAITRLTGQKFQTNRKSILFLDEIQAVPSALPALRYFYEKMPELPVIAAGSALEFALRDKAISVPVGRVSYMWLSPLSFREFLVGTGKHELSSAIENFSFTERPISVRTHEQLLQCLMQYFEVGGMPEAVASFAHSAGGKTSSISEIQRAIIQAYRDDIKKYPTTAFMRQIVSIIFEQGLGNIGRKVKYTKFSRDHQSRDIKMALSWLLDAGMFTEVAHTDANGIPLGAERDRDVRKLLFLDIGLFLRALGLESNDLPSFVDDRFVNEGAMAEQFVGQELIHLESDIERPQLCYWLREKKEQNAEIDFVISVGIEIVPIEVKAGAKGTLRSLTQFCAAKKTSVAVRLDNNLPRIEKLSEKTKLISLPLYLASEVRRVFKESRFP